MDGNRFNGISRAFGSRLGRRRAALLAGALIARAPAAGAAGAAERGGKRTKVCKPACGECERCLRGRCRPTRGGDCGGDRCAATMTKAGCVHDGVGWQCPADGGNWDTAHGANLRGADLAGCDLGQARLYHADLAGADLRGAKLGDAILYDANLVGADLTGAALSRAGFGDADLTDANLTRVFAWGTYFGRDGGNPATLIRATFADAYLRGTDLSGTNLRGANFAGADLTWANAWDADLRGADLSGTRLQGTTLYGADLAGADLGQADLTQADWLGTTCPDGTVSSDDPETSTCCGHLDGATPAAGCP